MKTWNMWAVEHDGELYNVGDRWYAKQHLWEQEETLVEVLVEELPDGDSLAVSDRAEGQTHWGWLGKPYGVWEEDPAHMQFHWGMFTMQFHYGPQADAKAGRGRIVRLKITQKSGLDEE